MVESVVEMVYSGLIGVGRYVHLVFRSLLGVLRCTIESISVFII